MSAAPRRGATRRAVLQAGMLGGLGLSLADLLRAAEEQPASLKPTADAVIFVHLKGGPAHLDTLDMKPDAPAEERGEFSRIATSVPGYEVCEHLPRLAGAIHKFALVRGISHAAGAHPLANDYLTTGNRPTPAVMYPSLGSVAALERPVPADLPGFVAIPNSDMTPGYLGVAHAALRTTQVPQAGKPFQVRGLEVAAGLTVEKIRSRAALLADLDQTFRAAQLDSPVLEGLDRFAAKAQEMILSPRAREAFDTSLESAAIRDLFAADENSQAMLLAARLVEQGVRFVTVTHDGWDTHQDNFQLLKQKLLPSFDAAMTALVAALEAKGLLERTLVVATGEFGRTPSINKNAGRDHWPRTMWTLLAGGGVRPGFIGGTDAKGHGPDDATHLKPDDLAASIYRALGIDPRKEYSTRTGRPVMLVSQGEVIAGLFT